MIVSKKKDRRMILVDFEMLKPFKAMLEDEKPKLKIEVSIKTYI